MIRFTLFIYKQATFKISAISLIVNPAIIQFISIHLHY
nr:MAG TPA: hypothetical protein [Caudoviricetes sp.]